MNIHLTDNSKPIIQDSALQVVKSTEAEAFKIRRRLSWNLSDFKDRLSYFCDSLAPRAREFINVHGHSSEIDDFKAFNAIHEKKPSHFSLDALGGLSLGNNKPFSNGSYNAVKKKYSKYYAEVKNLDFRMSLTRRTNSGWPLDIPGKNATASNLALGIQVQYVLDRVQRKYSFSDIRSELEGVYGKCLLRMGERSSSKDDFLKCWVNGSYGFIRDLDDEDNLLEPNVRMILMASKIDFIYNREKTKRFSLAMKNMPEHSQDRQVIEQRILSFKRFKYVYALDQKKFDRRNGGPKGRQASGIMNEVTGNDAYVIGYDTGGRVLTSLGTYEYVGGSIISSGIDIVTPLNLLCTDLAVLDIMADLANSTPAVEDANRGITYDYQNWGDDLIFASNYDLETISASAEKLGLAFDSEPRLKFLGTLYDRSDAGKPDRTIMLSSLFRNLLQPERPSVYPELLTLASAARRDQLQNHDLWRQIISAFELDITRFLGPKRPAYLDPSTDQVVSAMKWVQTNISDTFSDFDNILRIFQQGEGDITADTKRLLGLDDSFISSFEDYTSYGMVMKDAERISMKVKDPNLLLNRSSINNLFSSLKYM